MVAKCALQSRVTDRQSSRHASTATRCRARADRRAPRGRRVEVDDNDAARVTNHKLFQQRQQRRDQQRWLGIDSDGLHGLVRVCRHVAIDIDSSVSMWLTLLDRVCVSCGRRVQKRRQRASGEASAHKRMNTLLFFTFSA